VGGRGEPILHKGEVPGSLKRGKMVLGGIKKRGVDKQNVSRKNREKHYRPAVPGGNEEGNKY